MADKDPYPQIYPWRDGNHFRLLTDADAFYPVMLQAIAAARHYILLEMYLFESGLVSQAFIEALQQAAATGVQVYTLIDDLGSSKLNNTDRRALQGENMQLAIYNPLNLFKLFANVYRDHRKQLNIDGQLCITGGMGISDEFDPRYRKHPWREAGLEIRGPVVHDWQQLFLRNWHYCVGFAPELSAPAAPSSGTISGRVVTSRGGQQVALKGSVIHAIRRARQRVWISTAYFMPSRKLRRVLREADQRGVDVKLLVPGALTDHPSIRHAGRRYYGPLLRAGVQIFEYQPRFIHAKVVICDDWVSIGSANLDRWSFRWTLEANQEIRSAEFAQQVVEQFNQDLQESLEIGYAWWRGRSLGTRLKEWFWGGVDRMVEKLHHLLQLERLNPWRRRK